MSKVDLRFDIVEWGFPSWISAAMKFTSNFDETSVKLADRDFNDCMIFIGYERCVRFLKFTRCLVISAMLMWMPNDGCSRGWSVARRKAITNSLYGQNVLNNIRGVCVRHQPVEKTTMSTTSVNIYTIYSWLVHLFFFFFFFAFVHTTIATAHKYKTRHPAYADQRKVHAQVNLWSVLLQVKF